MTELPDELKKAEKCVFEIHIRYYGEVGKDERIDTIRVKRVAKALEDKWLPSGVVASFFEAARKELIVSVEEAYEKYVVPKLHEEIKLSRAQLQTAINHPISALRAEVLEKIDAVLGEERK